MKKLIFIFLVLSHLTFLGQRLNFGFSFSFMSLYYTHFKEDVVFARHSYRASYVNKNQFSSGTSINYNLLISLDYGRFIFTTEFGYFAQNDGLITRLDYPISYDGYLNFYSKISYAGYCVNPIVSYILTNRRQFRLFTEVGLPYMFLNESLTKEKLASGPKAGSGYWSNQDEMISEYGLKHDYFNVLVGIGYRMSFFSISVRYIGKINSGSDPGSDIGYLTFNMSTFANFSKLKKHYIYIE